jgi:phosphoserine phosphatase
MTDIILVRHGETDWNVAEVFRGRVDVKLNATGVKQAELLAEYLSNMRLSAIYSSPLQRALRTAEVIGEYNQLEVAVAPGLIDIDYGEWQGLSHQEVKERYKELYAGWVDCPGQVRMPAGESLDEVRHRALSVVSDVIGRHTGSVILVSHRVVNKVLVCALLGLDNSRFWNIRQDVGGITSFTCEKGQFILTRHNDTSYLKPLYGVTLGDF